MLGGFRSPVDCAVHSESRTVRRREMAGAKMVLTVISAVLRLSAQPSSIPRRPRLPIARLPHPGDLASSRMVRTRPSLHRKFPASLTPLSLVRLDVVDGELLERWIRHAQRSRFLCGAFHFPMIDHQPLDKPHRGCAPAPCTVNECRLAAFGGDPLHKLVVPHRIRPGPPYRHFLVPNVPP